VDALLAAKAATGDAKLAEAARSVVDDMVQRNARLSDAMAKAGVDAFPPTIVAMACAGEVGRVMDVICQRIADGLADGSFAVAPPDPNRAPVRFWRAFGRLLSSGVPILQSLALLREDAGDARLAEAADSMRAAIHKGQSLRQAMELHKGLFAPEVIEAIAIGEETGELDSLSFKVADAIETGDLASLPRRSEPLVLAAEPVVVQMVNDLIKLAMDRRASDVHLDPKADGAIARIRVDGVLHEVRRFSPQEYAQVVARLKIMANLDLAEKHLPQDGRMMLKCDATDLVIRLNDTPVLRGERIVMRLLPRDPSTVVLGLDRVVSSEADRQAIRRLCRLPCGQVIVTGPTGCGKTTLLYSMLLEMDRKAGCVLTVEDPVEYELPDVAQVGIVERLGVTFARTIRSFLRQAPNVIMVGEIRDLETAELVAQAALTGHLLMTTLHTNTALEVIPRLLDVGVKPFMVSATLGGAISLRLVRRLCECKRPAAQKEVKAVMLPPEARHWLASHPKASFFEVTGCEKCNGTGYRGRLAVHEVLEVNDAIRGAAISSDPRAALAQAAREAGFRTMLQSGLDLAAAGETSLMEVLRAVPI
jgi:type II secretory ATPase GspE/PulE/Tfp pilus assembly ATPase PilB-like protein